MGRPCLKFALRLALRRASVISLVLMLRGGRTSARKGGVSFLNKDLLARDEPR